MVEELLMVVLASVLAASGEAGRPRPDAAIQVRKPGETGSLAGNVSIKYSSRRSSSLACTACSASARNVVLRTVAEAGAAASERCSTGWFMMSVRSRVDGDQYWSTPLDGQRRRTVHPCQAHDVFCRGGGWGEFIEVIGSFSGEQGVPIRGLGVRVQCTL